jgi:hypothetical protein
VGGRTRAVDVLPHIVLRFGEAKPWTPERPPRCAEATVGCRGHGMSQAAQHDLKGLTIHLNGERTFAPRVKNDLYCPQPANPG